MSSGVQTRRRVSLPSLRESLISFVRSLNLELTIVVPVRSSSKVHLISPLPLLSDTLALRTSSFALAGFNAVSTDDQGNKKAFTQPQEVVWRKPKGDAEREEGRLVEVEVPGTLKQVTWHKRGDYFSTVSAPGKLFSELS